MDISDPRKLLASAIAASIYSGPPDRQADLVRRILMLAAPDRDDAPEQPAESGRIGVWQPVERDGRVSYVRVPGIPDAQRRDWADIAEIPPKGKRKRIVLLGESVARGFYSDPWLSPAQVLQAHLDAVDDPQQFEVIDLARNDMLSWELQELIRQALALAPDGFVLFAGNNWAKLPLVEVLCDQQLSELCAAIVRTDGVPGLAAYLSERAAAMAHAILGAVHDLPDPKIPTILVVPEFNLLDWSHEESMPPWLPGQAMRDWWDLNAQAGAALDARDFDTASRCAQQMIALDGETCPGPLALLARCRLASGATDDARRLLEKARDARVWDPPQGAVPQTLSSIQRALRAEQCRYIEVVDLPEVFRGHLGGVLPDRRLFLDYVHLSFEGAQIAMSAVARAIARVHAREEPALEALLARSSSLYDPEVVGQGHFCAAIHNAHWGQPLEVVQHHCSKALELSQKTAAVMREFLFGRRGPRWLYPLGAMEATPIVQRFLAGDGLRASRFDAVLREAVRRSLGVQERASHEEVLQHCLALSSLETEGEEDLLDPFYLPAWNDRSWNWDEHHYHRAYHAESVFRFDAGAQRPVVLRLTYRTSNASPGATFSMFVNESVVGRFQASGEWRSIQVDVPAHQLARGTNTVTIRWPALPSDDTDRLGQAADRLARGVLELTPVFGDIHSFKVCSTRQ